jgi:predicted amidophosphoribosyltransferase
MTAMPPRNDARNDTATCPACQKPFTRNGRQRWCSDACRQAAWRRRNPPAGPPPATLPPARPARDHTIYQCGECEQRYLGQQWCHDCNRPCQRIGPGGTCPNCDEPVALQDLITIT